MFPDYMGSTLVLGTLATVYVCLHLQDFMVNYECQYTLDEFECHNNTQSYSL